MSHHKVMSAPGGPQLQFQLAKGWVVTIDLKSALWVSWYTEMLLQARRCCNSTSKSFNNHLVNLLSANETLGEQCRRFSLQEPTELKCLYIFHHHSTQTHAHMLVLVIPGIYAAQYLFPGRQHFGQFLRMMCGTLAGSGKRLFVSQTKCKALMGCCVAWAREIPHPCSAGTLRLERRWGLICCCQTKS